MDTNRDHTPASYATAGVDEQREQDVFARAMRPWLARTAARSSMVTSISGLSSGYFATILQLQDGPPLALQEQGNDDDSSLDDVSKPLRQAEHRDDGFERAEKQGARKCADIKTSAAGHARTADHDRRNGRQQQRVAHVERRG